MVRKVLIAVGVTSLALTASACNTIRGAAADVESVADEVDEAT